MRVSCSFMEDTRSEASVVSYSTSGSEDAYVKTVYKLLAHGVGPPFGLCSYKGSVPRHRWDK